MFDRLLVPTDGSEGAIAAFEFALELADAVDADLHVLTVVNVYELQTVPERHAREAAASDHLEALAERGTDHGVRTTTTLEIGYPQTTIIDYSTANDIDLVVMGTHGRTGLEHVRLGSVAEKVVRHAPLPVLTVHHTVPTDGITRVVIATDGSECAAVATEAGIALASVLDASVHVLSVVEPLSLVPDVRTVSATETLTRRAEEAVEAVTEMAESAGLTVTSEVAEGRPYQMILDAVAPGDCLVLGAHGPTLMERFLLGGTTEKVVRSASVPVLTARAPEEFDE